MQWEACRCGPHPPSSPPLSSPPQIRRRRPTPAMLFRLSEHSSPGGPLPSRPGPGPTRTLCPLRALAKVPGGGDGAGGWGVGKVWEPSSPGVPLLTGTSQHCSRAWPFGESHSAPFSLSPLLPLLCPSSLGSWMAVLRGGGLAAPGECPGQLGGGMGWAGGDYFPAKAGYHPGGHISISISISISTSVSISGRKARCPTCSRSSSALVFALPGVRPPEPRVPTLSQATALRRPFQSHGVPAAWGRT